MDMWFINSNPSSGVTVGVSDNGITINGIANLFQAIKLDRNKQYTVVAKINGNIRSFTFTPDGTSQSNEYFEINGQRTTISGYDLIGVKYQGDTTTIEYVDLFEGSIAYPHVKEDYAIALARCRRYLYSGSVIFLRYVTTAENYDYFQSPVLYFLKQTMVGTPTGTIDEDTVSLAFVGEVSYHQTSTYNVLIISHAANTADSSLVTAHITMTTEPL